VLCLSIAYFPCYTVISNIAVFVLKRDVKLQPTNQRCYTVMEAIVFVILTFSLLMCEHSYTSLFSLSCFLQLFHVGRVAQKGIFGDNLSKFFADPSCHRTNKSETREQIFKNVVDGHPLYKHSWLDFGMKQMEEIDRRGICVLLSEIKTSGGSSLTKGCMAAAHRQFICIRQVLPMFTSI